LIFNQEDEDKLRVKQKPTRNKEVKGSAVIQ